MNFYDLAFDPEGVFDGRPSLFVSSLSQNDPTKNVVFRIGPDGSFLGIYIRFTAGASTQNFTRQPSAVLVPPAEQQNFLKGLFVGQANGGSALNGTTSGNFQALFFDANSFRPGQDLSGAALPERRVDHAADLRPAGRPDGGELVVHFADLLGLHRLRHPGRGRGSTPPRA